MTTSSRLWQAWKRHARKDCSVRTMIRREKKHRRDPPEAPSWSWLSSSLVMSPNLFISTNHMGFEHGPEIQGRKRKRTNKKIIISNSCLCLQNESDVAYAQAAAPAASSAHWAWGLFIPNHVRAVNAPVALDAVARI